MKKKEKIKVLDAQGAQEITVDVVPPVVSNVCDEKISAFEDEIKQLNKKIVGYKSYITQQNERIKRLEDTIRCLMDENSNAIKSLNKAKEDLLVMKGLLNAIYDMPWYDRIFLKKRE